MRVYVSSGVVYGCAAGKSKAIRLGQSGRRFSGVSVRLVKVAGRMAAYSLASHGVDTAAASVVVRRLTDGKRVHQDPATVGLRGPEAFQSVASLVVRASGGVAWIGSVASIGRPGPHPQVLRHDRRGLKLLDSGSSISMRSLRLHGSALRWKRGPVTLRSNLL